MKRGIKLKKLLKPTLVIIILLALILPIERKSNNPYLGKYCYDGNTNITIELKDNNSFVLSQAFGKGDECLAGKYSVKDNNIQLNFNNKSYDAIYKNLLTGKINGSVIYLKDSEKSFHLIKL